MSAVFCLFREVSTDGYNRDGKDLIAIYSKKKSADDAATHANQQRFLSHHFVEEYNVLA